MVYSGVRELQDPLCRGATSPPWEGGEWCHVYIVFQETAVTLIYNRITVKEYRKRLRNNMTATEKLIWRRIRKRQVNGTKFRRQFSIGPFIADFYCPSLKVLVEIDGPYHNSRSQRMYGRQREKYIEQYGIMILRYTNDDGYERLDEVIGELTVVCNALTAYSGQNHPPFQGGPRGSWTRPNSWNITNHGAVSWMPPSTGTPEHNSSMKSYHPWHHPRRVTLKSRHKNRRWKTTAFSCINYSIILEW